MAASVKPKNHSDCRGQVAVAVFLLVLAEYAEVQRQQTKHQWEHRTSVVRYGGTVASTAMSVGHLQVSANPSVPSWKLEHFFVVSQIHCL